jgi:hypothetical protein
MALGSAADIVPFPLNPYSLLQAVIGESGAMEDM